MKKIIITVGVLALAISTLSARAVTVTGRYVEARTSEVFAGACVVNGEAGTTGREALLAWKVDRGGFNGVSLNGLAVVAAVSGDTNLSVHEIGGEIAKTRAAVFLDSRATEAQRKALIAMVRALAPRTVGTIVETKAVPIEFIDGEHEVRVTTTAVRLVVQKHMDHDVTCGNKQWFQPLTIVAHAEMGATDVNMFDGASLGTRWSDPNKRSSFFGTFSF